MKKTIKRAALLFAASMLVASAAQAASFSVAPTGSFDATGLTSVTFDVFLDVEPVDVGYNVIAWDFDFWFDSTELAYTGSTMTAGTLALTSPENLYANYMDLVGSTMLGVGSNLIGSVSFDLLMPLQMWDGMADFAVLSQLGTTGADLRGILLDDMMTGVQFDGAEGADVGVVPIPGAAWLLGTGLVGLAGLRRKSKKS